MSEALSDEWGTVLDPNEAPPVSQPPPVDNSMEESRFEPEKVSKKKSEEIMQEAKDRFKRCAEYESYCRDLYRQDQKFVEGDSDNGFQWPDSIKNSRDQDNRPYLTINKTMQHCLQIINDAKQNKPSIKFKATGGGATYNSAQVWEGIGRHIEYQSNASTVYDTATETQVKCGIGYWRVVTDWAGDDTFDQEIFLKRIKDPLTVYLDPDIEEADGSDARFGFIFTDVPMDQFKQQYPKFAKKSTAGVNLPNDISWEDDEHVRVAEYYRQGEEEIELLSIVVNPNTGERQVVKSTDLSPDLIRDLKSQPTTKTRTTIAKTIEWYLLIGNEVAEKRPWPGKYVPIVRVIGQEVTIDGVMDRKGHVRAMKDPQRMYNYWTSGAAENVALQSKTPYIGAAAAIEGYETYWNRANTENFSILPYNHRDDEGQEIPRPQRQEPVTLPDAYVKGMTISAQELMMVTGQYQAQMGEQGNEVSGKAIGERQRQGDNATYHFIDNLAVAVRFTGMIILDLVPKIYDTERVIRILNEAGEESNVQINPNLKEPYQPGMAGPDQQEEQKRKIKTAKAIEHVLNPALGKYEVYADVGPAYSTRRQEAFNAFTNIITQAPQLTQIVGDILLRAGDFPMADEAAERLKRMVPAQALGDGPSPEVVALQEQVNNLQQSLAASIQALADKAAEIKVNQEEVQIKTFDAETKRITALLEAFNPDALAALVAQTVMAAISTDLASVKRTTEAFLKAPEVPEGTAQVLSQEDPSVAGPLLDQMGQQGGQGLDTPMGPTDSQTPPLTTPVDGPQAIQGMRQAKDGNYYLPDPNRPGKYLQVMG